MDEIGDQIATDLEEFAEWLEEPILSGKEYLLRLADALDNAVRVGEGPDEPEGTVRIWFSDTLARQIAARLRGIAGNLANFIDPNNWDTAAQPMFEQPEKREGEEGTDGEADA